jgi:hypothetical protein
LETVESFILCVRQAYKTQIKKIAAVLVQNQYRIEVTRERFTVKRNNRHDQLESRMLFLQVKALMIMKEKLLQMRRAIFENHREIARTRLEAVARADRQFICDIWLRASCNQSGWGSLQHEMCTHGSCTPAAQELYGKDPNKLQQDIGICSKLQLLLQILHQALSTVVKNYQLSLLILRILKLIMILLLNSFEFVTSVMNVNGKELSTF